MSQFTLGDIVSLTTHPFDVNISSIVIAGEPLNVSPLMVIVEIINETRNQFDEKTGNEISLKGNSQCKCIWYSQKSHQFEEAWLSSKQLKLIQKSESVSPKDLYFETTLEVPYEGMIVKNYYNALFKTSKIEYKKLKSSISLIGNSVDSDVKKITKNSLLSFVSPLLQIIQIVEAKNLDQKDLIYDQRSGKKKKFQSEYLIKCKWFNPDANKFSEKLLPIECIQTLPFIKADKLATIEGIRESGKYLEFRKSIIQIKEILFLDGIYSLKVFDYLKNKEVEIDLDKNLNDLDKIIDPILKEGPTFDFVDGESFPDGYFSKQYIELIEEANSGKNYIRITYKNRLDNVKTRTLKGLGTGYTTLTIDEFGKKITYLKGFCLTKEAERTFNIENIQKLQILNLVY